MRHQAIYNTHSTVVSINAETDARDIEGNVVELDENKITTEISRLETEWEAQEYARKRTEQYPPLAEQLDLLWHAIDAGTLDNRDHRNKFYSTLKEVKTNNPKG